MHKNPESLTLASPFSKSYWRTAAQELRNLRMLTLAAIVVALRIVLSGLYIPLGDNLNIFFGYFVNSLGAAIYGPDLPPMSWGTSSIPPAPSFRGMFFPPCWGPSSTPCSSTGPGSQWCG